ncbi:MAG TPA: kelch repeat-containing protein [Rhodanobacteraceae bacterium]|nr:kelch repeat-containing protein [Rhodanobacteraceae bacterium]
MRPVAALLTAALGSAGIADAATLQALVNQPPAPVGLPLLLTDGGVMFEGNIGDPRWWKLTPDANGSYLHGTWRALASFPAAWNYAPFAAATAVLADGRVLIEGGEYNPPDGPFPLTNKGAIYDPVSNTWTQVAPPSGWDFIGDSPSIVMPNGKFVLGNKLDMRIAELDPATMTWTELGSMGKVDFNAEEGWTLLPDGTFLTVDVLATPNTERYTYVDAPGGGSWTSSGSTPVSLTWNYGLPPVAYPGGTYLPPGETGPCMLRPNGTVFCTGASDETVATTAHTAITVPASGVWATGPDFLPGDDGDDSSAALLPNGNVLVSAESGRLYEFDGSALVPIASGHGGLLLPLPSGEVLISGGDVEIYTPDAVPAPDPSWAPTISDAPTRVAPGASYAISGTQFNGLSQAEALGDELQAPTNYPLVRIVHRASGHVTYARTHDHSSMGVATGSLVVSTTFDVPRSIDPGPSDLYVVANGIASQPVSVDVVTLRGHSHHARDSR